MHSHDRTMLSNLGFRDQDKGDPRHDLAIQYLRQPEKALALARRLYKDRLALGENLDRLFRAAEKHRPDQTVLDDIRRQWKPFWCKTYYSRGSFEIPKNQQKPPSLLSDLCQDDQRLFQELRCKSRSQPLHQLEIEDLRAEFHITKGTGQYRTTVGFADLILSLMSPLPYFSESYHEGPSDPRFDPFWMDGKFKAGRARVAILVEVKVVPLSVGDLLRQIALYREFLAIWPKDYDFSLGDDNQPIPYKTVAACCFPFTPDEIKLLAEERIGYIRLGEDFDRFCAEQASRKPSADLSTYDL